MLVEKPVEIDDARAEELESQAEGTASPTAGKEWEGSHLPIFLLGLLGIFGLAAVMGGIFILSPLFYRI